MERLNDFNSALSSLEQGNLLSELFIHKLIHKAKELLISESNVCSLSSPITLVGDVHGQFYDVLEIFKIGGKPPSTSYLFLGDYVDRGYHSIETITYLTALKVLYPNQVTLIRGNHESRAVTQVYGFYAECKKKYGDESGPRIWKMFTDLFDYLPLAAEIDTDVLALHGGISPLISTVDDIRLMDRFQEIPHDGAMADIMWSDPETSETKEGFLISPRGAGYTYGKLAFDAFMKVNGLGHLFRAHQLCMEGYQVIFDGKLSTVWSAPNYCYRCGNAASIVELSSASNFNVNVYRAAPESSQSTSEGIIKKLKLPAPDYFL